jgi:hypothetical protein
VSLQRERLLVKCWRQASGLQEAWSSELTREGMRSWCGSEHGMRRVEQLQGGGWVGRATGKWGALGF